MLLATKTLCLTTRSPGLYKALALYNNRINMTKLKDNKSGFVLMIVMLLAILIAAIALVYTRVLRAHT